jgi:hypothetical protein
MLKRPLNILINASNSKMANTRPVSHGNQNIANYANFNMAQNLTRAIIRRLAKELEC